MGKLVRDNIPNIISESGNTASFKILSYEEYVKELLNKLNEEVDEYFDAESDEEALEELGDILTVINHLAEIHGANMDILRGVQYRKDDKRGGFTKKYYLLDE